MYRTALLSLLLVCTLTACQSSSDDEESSAPSHHPGRMHPIADRIPPGDATVTNSIPPEGLNHQEDGEYLKSAREILRNATLVQTFGDSSGSRREVIGEVQDAALTDDGQILVLDRAYYRIMAFQQDGSLAWTYGREGEGPGEFSSPWELEHAERGWWLVTDRSSGLKIFERQDTTLTHVNTLPRTAMGESVCTVDDHIYATRRRIRRRSLNPQDSSAATFGAMYQADNRLMQWRISEREVACSSYGPTIVGAFRFLPIVQFFTSKGSLRLTARIEDFTPFQMEETSGSEGQPGITFAPAGIDDRIVSAVTLPGGYALVQIQRDTEKSREADKEYARLMTYLFTMNANGIYVTDKFPYIYDATEEYILTGSDYPYPEVQLYQLNGPIKTVR